MSAVRFAPWVGSQYAEQGFRGLRVLLLGESHHGSRHNERPSATPEIVRALAMGGKHPLAKKKLGWHSHYSKILTSLHDQNSAANFGPRRRAAFWEQVAYFNVIQQFMPPGRQTPAPDLWRLGMLALAEVLQVLQPQIVVCFSKRCGEHVQERVSAVPLVVVNHPSSGFEYALVNPSIRQLFDSVMAQSESPLHEGFLKTPIFDRWREQSHNAMPAHGPRLDKADLVAVHMSWAFEMAEVDRSNAALRAANDRNWMAGADEGSRGQKVILTEKL